MTIENNIIAIRKADKPRAHRHFETLMDVTEKIINDDAAQRSAFYKKLSATELEAVSLERIREACANSPFDANEVKLISGQHFPDIIANTYYGVEVKSTKQNHWTSTGSSIVESTRDVNVDDIYMLFGKMGGDVPEFKCRPYEEVLYDIAVTHSPRYLINMELKKADTIFAKMGTTYDDLRTSDDAINKVRRYYREKAVRERKQEMPWWITSENVEYSQSFNIQLWNTLSNEKQEELQAKCMILFPEALNPERSMTKYNQTSLWLCSYYQVIVPNIRDFYSAGGQITHVDGKKLAVPVPQVFNRIVKFANMIRKMLANPEKDLQMLIEDYNAALLKTDNPYEQWLKICCGYAKPYGIPLETWIEKSPQFTFSNK